MTLRLGVECRATIPRPSGPPGVTCQDPPVRGTPGLHRGTVETSCPELSHCQAVEQQIWMRQVGGGFRTIYRRCKRSHGSLHPYACQLLRLGTDCLDAEEWRITPVLRPAPKGAVPGRGARKDALRPPATPIGPSAQLPSGPLRPPHIGPLPHIHRLRMPLASRRTVALRPLRRGLPFLLAAALACGGDRQGGNFVTMYDNAFNAAVVRVPVGVRVKWINVGKNPHNAVATDGSWSTGPGNGGRRTPRRRARPRLRPAGRLSLLLYLSRHSGRQGDGRRRGGGRRAIRPGPRGAVAAVAEATGACDACRSSTRRSRRRSTPPIRATSCWWTPATTRRR